MKETIIRNDDKTDKLGINQDEQIALLKKQVSFLKQELEGIKRKSASNEKLLRHLENRNDVIEENIYMNKKYHKFAHLYTKFRKHIGNRIVELQILKEGYFDTQYYLENYPDIKKCNINAVKHYISRGNKEWRNPNEWFDTSYYLSTNKDVAQNYINGLYHYMKYGFREGRKPSREADMYLEWCRHQKSRNKVIKLMREIKDAYFIYKSKLFDGEGYLVANKDVREALMESKLWHLRKSKFALARFVGRLGTSAVLHYVRYGVYEDRNPNQEFDNSVYINNNLDILSAKGINPFTHYVRHGIHENRIYNHENNTTSIQDQAIKYTNKLVKKNKLEIMQQKVAIIVPKSHSAEELETRLSSIYEQDYKKIEVIIIQDNNTPEIKKVIDRYVVEHKNNTRKIVVSNENARKNIWKQAIEEVTAKFIWVLEEGSRCEKEFLSELIPYFADELVNVVECKSIYKDAELNNIESIDKRQNGISTGWIEVQHLLSENNAFYELGAIIFRNPREKQWFQTIKWNLGNRDIVKCLLLNLLSNGKKFYSSKVLHEKIIDNNYFSRSYINKESCKGHEELCKIMKSEYGISPDTIKLEYERVRTDYLTHSGKTIDHFTGIYDIESVMSGHSKVRILISIVAFTHGGGEIMPIRLANQLKEMGYPVMVHNYELDSDEELVRKMLDPEIPVIRCNNVEEMSCMLKLFNIDVVSTHHQALQSFIARVLEKDLVLKNKINHVATSHGMYENFSKKELTSIFETVIDNTDYWTYVADKNIIPFKEFNVYDQTKFIKISNGMKYPKINPISRASMQIEEDAFVVCTVSRALPEKGWKEAIKSVEIARKITNRDIQLLLIGEGTIYEELKVNGTPDYVHLLGFKDTPCDYYAISDLALLTSYYKSESAPLTIIEALLSHTPIVASNVGDVRQMLSLERELAGDIFDLNDWKVPVEIVGEKIANLVMDSNKYDRVKATAINKAKEFSIENVADRYLDVFRKKVVDLEQERTQICFDAINDSNLLLSNAERGRNSIKVSVIVPNYNHGKYLRQRLECIYNQTYKNIEVILMDDCSSDNSRAILSEYAQKYSDITKVLFNEVNSGGVFHQWMKGIKNATGDICWIAESDDYCDLNFIEKLMPAFADSKVRISYSKYVFVDSQGKTNTFNFSNYVESISKEKWEQSYINDANSEVNDALAVKNTIPNASGVLFRKPLHMDLFNDKDWVNMKICGDWIFYLNLLLDGKIAYSTETQSYFRFHNNNSSAATHTKSTYYKEHEAVAYTIRKLYNVSDEVLLKNYEIIKKFYIQNVKGDSMDFNKLYDIKSILCEKMKKKPKVEISQPSSNYKIINYRADEDFNTVVINPIFSAGKNMESNVEEKVRYTGNNTGNLLFVESIKEQLGYVKETWLRPGEISSVENASAVMPASNFIINGGDTFIEQCMEMLEGTTCPVTMAGLGAQSSKELNTPKKLVQALTPTKIKFFKMLSERAVSLGIRGEFTAQCLEEMGIHNYRIIGCPSAYKYLDGEYKILKAPTSERVMFTTTTGNEHERKIVEMGMSARATWIMQMMTEMPEVALEGKMPNEKWMQIRFPGLTATPEEFKIFMQEHAKMFFRINDWYDYYKEQDFTFSYGSRFHGNMSALRSGIPALWIVHDSRTTELVNTLKLPNIDFETFDKIKSIEELINYCDYSEFYKNYKQLTKEYVNFLEENNLKHKFSIK